MANKLIHVAVGVIFNADGNILIAKRAENAHQGGLWEFPGGKVNPAETLVQALNRELNEELGICVNECSPLIQIRHHYPDKSVLLDVFRVTSFNGEPYGVEGQPIYWAAPNELPDFKFPAANKPIISAVLLPDRYLITGEFADTDELISKLESAFKNGIRIAQLRIKNLELSIHESVITRAILSAEKYSATLMINCSVRVFLQIACKHPSADIGLHLSQQHALGFSQRPVPDNYLLGVSCHNEGEITQAQVISADYLLLSPVKTTATHPNASPLGWEKFKSLVELANIPVFALGGLNEMDVAIAKACGAQGIAAIRAWWND